MTDAAHHARRSRKLVGVVLAAVVALVVPLTVVSSAQGAPPTSPVAGVAFTFTSVGLPETPGSDGLAYVVANEDFAVTVDFLDAAGEPAAFSDSKTTTVALRYDGATLGSPVDVPAEGTRAAFSGLTIPNAASGTVLTLVADTKPRPDAHDSEPFDVLLEDEATQPDLRAAIGGEGGTDTECNATPDYRICADLVPPVEGFLAGGLLSRGLCPDGEKCRVDYIQALAPFRGINGIGAAPATLIMKCDKAECGGGAIKKQQLDVTISPNPLSDYRGTWTAPACPAKGTVEFDESQLPISEGNLPFCVDYVQSTRDNAGDTHLYLLFVVDAKVRFS